MTNDFDVRGTEDLARLTRALRAAGESGKGLRKELYASLNRETKQTREDMKASIPASLPSRGGLASLVYRKARLSTSTRGGGRNVGVRIKGRRLAGLNAGRVRHPVFGRANSWVTQTKGIRAGFLDEAFERDKPQLQQAVVNAINAVGNQIDRKV